MKCTGKNTQYLFNNDAPDLVNILRCDAYVKIIL